MRLDLRLHGKLDDGRKCSADVSVYVTDPSERFKAVDEAAKIAPWFVKEKGLPDVPEGANITLEEIENLKPAETTQEEMPGSLQDFLKNMGLVPLGAIKPPDRS